MFLNRKNTESVEDYTSVNEMRKSSLLFLSLFLMDNAKCIYEKNVIMRQTSL